MQNLDPRYFSNLAYEGLTQVKIQVKTGDQGKASSAAQSLTTYLSTWGLHRLSGDCIKYQKRGSATEYKGIIYKQFLLSLLKISPVDFRPEDPQSILSIDNLHSYTGLNRLAISLAKEWSFWAVPVLGEAKEE